MGGAGKLSFLVCSKPKKCGECGIKRGGGLRYTIHRDRWQRFLKWWGCLGKGSWGILPFAQAKCFLSKKGKATMGSSVTKDREELWVCSTKGKYETRRG